MFTPHASPSSLPSRALTGFASLCFSVSAAGRPTRRSRGGKSRLGSREVLVRPLFSLRLVHLPFCGASRHFQFFMLLRLIFLLRRYAPLSRFYSRFGVPLSALVPLALRRSFAAFTNFLRFLAFRRALLWHWRRTLFFFCTTVLGHSAGTSRVAPPSKSFIRFFEFRRAPLRCSYHPSFHFSSQTYILLHRAWTSAALCRPPNFLFFDFWRSGDRLRASPRCPVIPPRRRIDVPRASFFLVPYGPHGTPRELRNDVSPSA
ncbi:hypothetical protein C8R43DRAFT_1236324, partial [Mycena crocata]